MHWQSTLPILWYRSLVSKWIVAATTTVTAFLVTFVIMYWANGRSIYFRSIGIEYEALSFGLSILQWIVPLALFSSIFVLLVDEPLYGLGLAGIALGITGTYYVTTTSGTSIYAHQLRWGTVLKSLLPILSYVGQGMLAISMIFLYRWRWYRGHQASIFQIPKAVATWFPSIANLSLSQAVPSKSLQMKTRVLSFANRPFLSLLAQSSRQAFLFRLVIVFAPWVWFATLGASAHSRAIGGLVVGVTFSVLLLGLSCFTHDHSKQRIRFLSDRGISSWQFYLARTIPTLFASVCLIAAVAIVLSYYENLDKHPISLRVLFGVGYLCVYFVGQLVGLCLRNVILSLAVAILILYGNIFIGYMITFGSEEVTRSSFQSSYEDFVNFFVVQVLCIWMLTVILISMFWTVPQWLRWEQARFGLATGLVLTGFVGPALLIGIFTTVAYLSLPNPKWIVDTQPLKTLLSDDAALVEYRRWSIERATVYQERLKESNLTPDRERTFARYGMEKSLPFDKPTNPLLFIPNALVNRFILSNMSREFTAEIEAVDELIARSNQASESKTSRYEDLQIYIKARVRHGLPDFERSPLSVNLSHFLRSRDKSEALQSRMEALQSEQ